MHAVALEDRARDADVASLAHSDAEEVALNLARVQHQRRTAMLAEGASLLIVDETTP